MLIASFAEPGQADRAAARHAKGLVRLGPGLLMWRDTDRWPDVPAPLIGLQGDIVDRRTARRLPATAVAAALAVHGIAAFADWAPPFRLAWQDGDTVRAAADHQGLGHWFTWTAPGVAVIADSATAIARRFGLGVDTMALAGLALTGAMVGLDSAIAGVGKLAAGSIAELAGGGLSLSAMPPPSRLAAPADAIAAAVARLRAAHDVAEIELSGGWDSRLMLAALPAADRPGTTGFTIGTADAPDVIVAAHLAAHTGMRHVIVDQWALGRLPAADFAAVLHSAAARDDFTANPLDRAGVNVINAGRPPVARFSGQNGEILRGFYYPGQPLDAAPSASLAARVIGWRIISNDLVDPALFDPAWLATARAAITARLTEQLLGGDDASWGDALDRFYLDQRMHRWCGTAVSATLGRRPVLLPFFDADVLALARATPAAQKNASRFVAQEIARLDPGLAAIALDSGLVPAAVARGGVGNRIAQARHFVAKATAKLQQRLSARDRATIGSATAGSLALRHGLNGAIDVDRLAGSGIFSRDALAAFARGDATPGRATLGFVLTVDQLFATLMSGDGA